MTWTEHSDGVFSKHYESLDLNVGLVVSEEGLLVIDTRALVVSEEGLLVIDTRAHHRQARQLIEDIKTISSRSVRWVVNTHHHWDHTFGNGEFFDSEIWGHELCARHLADHGMSMLERIKGLLFTDEELQQAEAFDEVVLVPPSQTFTDSAGIEVGFRTVEMTHLGRGHTDNDIVVRVSEVTFAGDLIEEGAPPSYGDAYPLEWPDTAERLHDLVTGPVVPGHGKTVDGGFVATQAEELSELARLARERKADGMSWQQAAAAGGPFPRETLDAAFERAWAHLES